MNDLRSRNRSLAAVPDEVPTSTPPRVRPAADDAAGRRMSRRQSIAERARRLEAETDVQADAEVEIDRSVDTDQQLTLDGTGSEADHRWSSSRPTAEEPEVVASADAEAHVDADLDGEVDEGPSSRPDRRRQPQDDEAPDEDKFPWHFQFDDDEPEELQASSPLLSRAFRATIG